MPSPPDKQTNWWTDQPTKPLIEMRGNIKSSQKLFMMAKGGKNLFSFHFEFCLFWPTLCSCPTPMAILLPFFFLFNFPLLWHHNQPIHDIFRVLKKKFFFFIFLSNYHHQGYVACELSKSCWHLLWWIKSWSTYTYELMKKVGYTYFLPSGGKPLCLLLMQK